MRNRPVRRSSESVGGSVHKRTWGFRAYFWRTQRPKDKSYARGLFLTPLTSSIPLFMHPKFFLSGSFILNGIFHKNVLSYKLDKQWEKWLKLIRRFYEKPKTYFLGMSVYRAKNFLRPLFDSIFYLIFTALTPSFPLPMRLKIFCQVV